MKRLCRTGASDEARLGGTERRAPCSCSSKEDFVPLSAPPPSSPHPLCSLSAPLPPHLIHSVPLSAPLPLHLIHSVPLSTPLPSSSHSLCFSQYSPSLLISFTFPFLLLHIFYTALWQRDTVAILRDYSIRLSFGLSGFSCLTKTIAFNRKLSMDITGNRSL